MAGAARKVVGVELNPVAVADAKANAKIADAKADASADKREADYKVALERCDAISGSAKEACVSQAKAKYKH